MWLFSKCIKHVNIKVEEAVNRSSMAVPQEASWLSSQRRSVIVQNVAGSNPGWASRQVENCQPSSKWVPFLDQGRMGKQERRGTGSTFHMLCPRYNKPLTPIVP